jgi:hypothetical protein
MEEVRVVMSHFMVVLPVPQIVLGFSVSRDGCSAKGDISKEIHCTLQRADLCGFAPQKPWQNVSSRPSQTSVKPSKISLPPDNAIDIALSGMPIPGESLARLRFPAKPFALEKEVKGVRIKK